MQLYNNIEAVSLDEINGFGLLYTIPTPLTESDQTVEIDVKMLIEYLLDEIPAPVTLTSKKCTYRYL